MRWHLLFGFMASVGLAARATADALSRFDDALMALDDDVALV